METGYISRPSRGIERSFTPLLPAGFDGAETPHPCPEIPRAGLFPRKGERGWEDRDWGEGRQTDDPSLQPRGWGLWTGKNRGPDEGDSGTGAREPEPPSPSL
uniref:Uncharacterized protein n=1 Tax=Chromera velia CCMP2878 TaxID=1169474 RepID=A0A0G4H5W0_9ALVE|eukprot:Cvel_24812.t1-p1 / transcript=Cvel_24812.t1 / gene=Cvel_24812 / organism=Chromera_velia_CCMP2878 / gene_product=hypothetical protein / transcript_product=hypothetical protein / location=Cvel_scaffold2733:4105-4407(-) / protein_length=101 / sequence_SO=supercontig / SO=protein_coding / is_pseudo=false